MAITLADFTKIWASTSPLTPYSFTDSNYQEGWNFVGATPPARQMWDYIQKQNDEKLKYIVDNFLPLSGGTMTGSINTSGKAVNFGTGSDDDGRIYPISNYLRLTGGNSTSNGSWVDIGSSSSSNLGVSLNASNGSGTTKTLKALYDGTLTWDDTNIVTNGVVNGHGIQMGSVSNITVTAGNTKTGSITFSTAFDGSPKVFVTQNGDYGGVYPCTGNISATGFQWRLNSTRSSDVTTSIDWLAIY